MPDSYIQRLMDMQMHGISSMIEAMHSTYGSQLQTQMRLAVSASQSMNPIFKFQKEFNQLADASNKLSGVALIQKQINSLRVPPQSFAEQLNAMRSLSQTMAPLLKNRDIRVASKANQIFQNISNDPVGSFNEVIESSHDAQKLVTNHNDDYLRNQAQLEKQSEDSATESANTENGSYVINSAIENYQKTIDRSSDKYLDVQYCINFFNYLFHIGLLLFMAIGISGSPHQSLEFLITFLDTLSLYFSTQRHRNDN